ncbi:pseudouridine synthase [Arcticibacter tournemirensis]|uniref:Pseudouridine synthase n=1 Tax=Arcticibacter tournemirensis TaxID=699437 RepID=A0A4Q0M4L2_9SPHI|nr:pseudouridine synthase [Arcticibacter tournemirensis]RXF67887.1 pseudouridine synthase [Arcticibacter tournemirensis]
MPDKNNRNSREDKSLKNNRFEGNSKNERPKRSNSGSKKMFDGDRKPYSGDSSRDTKPAFRDKDKDSRPFRERSSGTRPFTEGRREKPEGGRSFERGASKDRSFDKRPYNSDKSEGGRSNGDRSFDKRPYNSDRKEGGRPAGDRPFEKRPYNSDKREGGRSNGDRPFEKRPYRGDRKEGDRPSGNRSFEKRPYGNDKRGERGTSGERPFERKPFKPERRRYEDGVSRNWTSEEHLEQAPVLRSRKNSAPKDDELIRLNRYIANAGICSRRKADELIEAGVISVNGEVVSELGYKINPMKDLIRYNGETLKREKMVYVLLNKPKDYITTTDDPQERRTVMHLVEKASKERIYPIGRLDRNTTGLLLMTNDGDLAEKLSHPRNNITKIYQVELNKNLTQGDLNKIAFGVELEDGLIKPDVVSYVQGGTKREIGIQIHSGKNRIVRRIFEHLGYEVEKLDRVVYANLTKKDLPRGRWRYLEEKEVIQLKHLIK